MSVLVALADRHAGSVWIGSDTQVTTSGVGRKHFAGGKWSLARSGWAIGIAGPLQAAQVVDQAVERILAHPEPRAITEALKAAFGDAGWNPQTKETYTPEYGFDTLVAGPTGDIWHIDASLGWLRCEPHYAIGSGGGYALGAFEAMRRVCTRSAVHQVEAAIEAACALDSSCGGTSWVQKLATGTKA